MYSYLKYKRGQQKMTQIKYPNITDTETRIYILQKSRELIYLQRKKLNESLRVIDRELLTCDQIIRLHKKEDL